MISGSCKILVFVALEILLSYKIMLMGITRPEGVVKFLRNVSKNNRTTLFVIVLIVGALEPYIYFFPFQIPQENTDAIVTKAIDLWHKYCGTPVHAV